MKGEAKQVENSGTGSLPQPCFSSRRARRCIPKRKWYMACAGLSLAIGGSTPNASAVRKSTWSG